MATDSLNKQLALPLIATIIIGSIIALVAFGARSSFGIFTLPVTEDLGFSRQTYGMAMAIQNLAWGIAQPFAGGFADKYGTARVLVVGALIYAGGMIAMAMASSVGIFYLGAGILVGIGVAATSFGIIMAAFGRLVPPEKRTLIFGVATAASSLGQFVFAPLGQAFISSFGWNMALIYIAALVLLIIPLAVALRGKTIKTDDEIVFPAKKALAMAWENPSFRLLTIGFFVCGFYLAFVTIHLPPYLVQNGLSAAQGSWAIAIIGLFNVLGSLLAGYLGGKFPKQILLAAIYLIRVVATLAFLFVPVSLVSTYVFAAVLGLVWLATIPLTAGLVSQFFGPRYLGMLYGTVFLSHQLGSFFGVWLGGLIFDLTGSYNLLWILAATLSLISAVLHIPIKERRVGAFFAPAT
ncbi:MAG: MFS transporter [Devosiaceae bacterium]|nr:MFS transporter [Devosiaceae bacterium]